MALIEWEDCLADEFSSELFNANRYNENRLAKRNANRYKKHVYEIIPEFDCNGRPIVECCVVEEDYPLCRKALNETANGSYPACLNRSFRVVERRLIYTYW